MEKHDEAHFNPEETNNSSDDEEKPFIRFITKNIYKT